MVISLQFPAAFFDNRADCSPLPIIGHLTSNQGQISQESQRFRSSLGAIHLVRDSYFHEGNRIMYITGRRWPPRPNHWANNS